MNYRSLTLSSLIACACVAHGITTPSTANAEDEVQAKATATSPKKTETGKKSGLPTNLAGPEFSKLPTYIKSDSLTLKSEERYFIYNGNVEVTHGDMILTSELMEGTYSEKNEIIKLEAKTNVVITKGEDIKGTAQSALYDAVSETVTLSDNPELQQKESVLTADKIIVFLKDNRSSAEGDVRVKMVKKDNAPVEFKLKDSH